MNAKRLASELRSLGAYQSSIGNEYSAILFGHAAAACEEEGEEDHGFEDETDERINKLLVRIAALEETRWVYDRALGVLDDRLMKMEADDTLQEVYMVESSDRIASLEETVKAIASDIAAILGSRLSTAPPPAPDARRMFIGGDCHTLAPPPAPEEPAAFRCYCGFSSETLSAWLEHRKTLPHTPAPSPEQAQEMPEDHVCTEKCNAESIDPPEAQWTMHRTHFGTDGPNKWHECRKGAACSAFEHTEMVQLRPGERIVSGEGVLVHKHAPFLWCEKRDCGPGVAVGTVYHLDPDAPPRAEGE